MNHLKRPYLFVHLSLLIICQSAIAQENNSAIREKFTRYKEQDYIEKIFVHTSKDFFLAGEIIWFKIYLVDGNLQLPSQVSKVAYAELIGPGNKIIMQAKTGLHNSTGNGSFLLPASINTGNYTLRVYTNWMKNSDPEFYFTKTISVVNTFKKPDWQQLEKKLPAAIQFFPEGGNMVAGLPARLAFKATDSMGAAADCQGILYNSHRDTVAIFHSRHQGMGHFEFTPQAGEVYEASVIINGALIHKKLPTIFPEGIVMMVSRDTAAFIVNIAASTPLNDQTIVMLANTRQQLKQVSQTVIKNGKAVFRLDKDSLGEGISVITIINQDKVALCERLVFKKPTAALHFSVQSESKTYSTRTKTVLSIHSKNPAGKPVGADLSLSVFLVDDLQKASNENIYEYFWLRSDLTGPIENPAFYFDSTTNNDEALDDLLMTQGWRRFRWEDIIQQKAKPVSYLPEYEGMLVSGTLISNQTGQPAAGIPLYLSLPGKRFSFVMTQSNFQGRYHAVAGNYYGTRGLFVKSSINGFRILPDNNFSQEFANEIMPPLHISVTDAHLLKERNIAVQAMHAYRANEINRFAFPPYVDSLSFYGKPDKKYYLDDYTRFTTMEEVLREYIPEVRVRKNDGQFHFQVKNSPGQNYFDQDPLVLLDGLPVHINPLMNYDPLKLQKIEIMTRKFYTNEFPHAGIVSFFTYEGDAGEFESEKNTMHAGFTALQPEREFYTPDYSNAINSRVPDFRNVLTWQPGIRTDDEGKANVSFFTSDLAGSFVIVLQGMTGNGLSGGIQEIITVKQ